MKWVSYFLLLLAIGILAGCNFPVIENPQPGNASSWNDSNIVYQTILETAPPGSTPTPTPFLPLDPTAITLPTSPEETPTWENYPGPTVPPAVPIPSPAPLFEQPSGQINVLLLGSDQRPNDGGFRTDTILLVTLNPNQGKVSITSFPRDLYVYIPGWTMQRINTAQQHGGFELTKATFEYNFGVRPEYYIQTNFWGFVAVVDNLGGIYVDVAKPLTDHRDQYGNYTVPAGRIFMDGETALWYVRSRYSTSDFDRTRRQQEVIVALFNRFITLDALGRIPELYKLYNSYVTTNVTLESITPFLGLAAKTAGDLSSVQSFTISSQNVDAYQVPTTGAQVLLPKQDQILEIIRQALNAP